MRVILILVAENENLSLLDRGSVGVGTPVPLRHPYLHRHPHFGAKMAPRGSGLQ